LLFYFLSHSFILRKEKVIWLLLATDNSDTGASASATHTKQRTNLTEADTCSLHFFVNADKTVNLPEGVTLDSKGMLWVASEGKGSAGDRSAPNVLVQFNMLGVIQKAGELP
jgi:uncharacterized protein YjiK